MDQETIQKAVEAIQRFMKPIVEAITRLWRAFKAWLSKHPATVSLLRREMAKRSKRRVRPQPLPAVKVYRSQVTYRSVPRVARSRC
ncbi:hypothetical protein J2TS6_55020 [Paenibacillus albilobatus]|uniref:Uncharacterized protein n=1 Tax=Paenibacillus albilobatus TaxID=2716884 RepID=A0A920CC70_9BACL|nr:hypothetical protein J2TS6_55020 [Paenibacillus albilobatus]